MGSIVLMGMVMPVEGASLYWDGASSGADADGGTGSWTTGGAANWDTAAMAGSDVSWTDGSEAVFGGTGGVVAVSGMVGAGSLTFNSPGYRVTGGGTLTLSGTPVIATGANDVTLEPVIAGSAAISKTGTGGLTLGGANGFSGAFTIAAGTVKAGSAGAFGTTAGATTISSGATLDVNGQGLGSEAFKVSGAGVGGAGAIVNTGAAALSAISGVTMTGATTIGGTTNWSTAANSTIAMGGSTLTKVGANEIGLSATFSTPGNIDIKQGTLTLDARMGGSTTNTVTVRSGATLGTNGWDRVYSWSAILEAGTTWRTGGNPASALFWTGPISIAGATTFDAQGSDAHMSTEGVISGAGSVIKTGTGSVTFSKVNTYTGGTTVNAGELRLNASSNGAGTVRGPVTVNAGATLTLYYAGSLGSTTGARVNPLNVTGGLLYNLSGGMTAPPVLNLTGSRVETHSGSYSMSCDAVVNSLAAAVPSVIDGNVYLSSGNTGSTSVFNVADGEAVEDLRIEGRIAGAYAANGMTKRGSGTMSVNGQVTYQGPTLVEGGTLLLESPEDQLKDSAVTVSAGACFGLMAGGKTVASIAAKGGSALVLPALTSGATVVTGALDLGSGNISIRPMIGPDATPGVYDLITAGSITGSGVPVVDFNSVFGATRATGSVAVVGNKLRLILTKTGSSGLVWNNASAGGATNGSWDMVLANFSNGMVNDRFRSYDSVTFDDSVAADSAKTITLGTVLAPARMTVNNSNGDYTFNGSGRLTGVGTLVKTGSSKLTLAGQDSYKMSGPIVAGGGVLHFDDKSQISASSLVVKSGATIDPATIATGPMELQSGTVKAKLTGSASWTKTTADTVSLTADNSLSGPGTVTAGHLVVGDLNVPGWSGEIGPGPVVISNGAALSFGGLGSRNVMNSFSGSGSLNFRGPSSDSFGGSYFYLGGRNDDFSGPVAVRDATLVANFTGMLGSGPVSLTGRAQLRAGRATVANAITLTPVGSSVGSLSLSNTTLGGPITLPGGVTTAIYGPDSSASNTNSTISGPIGESGGPASIRMDSFTTTNSFTLSGASTYTGATTIGANVTMKLTGSLGATAVTVGGASVLEGNGVIGSGGSLTFASGGILRVSPSGGVLTVNGNVNLGPKATIAVNVTPGTVITGPIPVLNYTGTLTGGAANLTMDAPNLYRKASFGFPPGQITVDLENKALVWKRANGSWDSTTSKNWSTSDAGTVSDYFYKGDSVLFNDSGPGGLVSGQEVVWPSAVVVDNAAKSYQLDATIFGPCSLIKRGSGVMYLSSYNAYSGGTIVEGGRFEVGGSVGSGPVSIAAGAELGGNQGALECPVTIAGMLDPGFSQVTVPGGWGIGYLTTRSLTLSGNYRCQLESIACDLVQVQGDLNLTGSTLTVVPVSQSGFPDPCIIATYSGNLLGRFAAISGVPEGYGVKYDTATKRILIVRTSYANWIASQPGVVDTTNDGDPDRDGIPNLVEYVVGGNAGASDPGILPTQEIQGDHLIFRYKRSDASRTTTTQTVQWSHDMKVWTDIPVPVTSAPPVVVVPDGNQQDDITVTIPRAPGCMYVRLRVTQP
ncbi:beta strand repeat-containing protein [Luteolibacter soli]|uniref:Autotransporter-associated beta strand repeat-containing protein n=1 Tax=Luteolibacter soli TaxID=3135280 RepID=A0ABU9AVJ3_9BACT